MTEYLQVQRKLLYCCKMLFTQYFYEQTSETHPLVNILTSGFEKCWQVDFLRQSQGTLLFPTFAHTDCFKSLLLIFFWMN